MPRRNPKKTKPHVHGPSIYDPGYNPRCNGCAFAGLEVRCTTSDGKCLLTDPKEKEADVAGRKR